MRYQHRWLWRYQSRRHNRSVQRAEGRRRVAGCEANEATAGKSVTSFQVSGFEFQVGSSQFETRNLKLEADFVPIAVLTIELRIEGAHSLKDKRQVLRSLKDKLRSGFNVSVAELDQTDLWQRATIGVVSISSSRDYLSGLMQQVERAANRIANDNGAEVTDSFVDME